MRISDWSSDVCSSDLAGAVENQRIIAVATEQIVGSVDHPAAVDDIVAVAQRDRRGADRRVVEVDNIVAPSRIHDRTIVGDVDGTAARAGVDVARTSDRQALGIGTRIDITRSEENTSELQSLMRISNAV